MKMTQGGTMYEVPDDQNMVEALDGGVKTVQSPNQNTYDSNWDQLQANPVVYNFSTTNISGFQKIMLYSAFFGIAYIIYKKFKR